MITSASRLLAAALTVLAFGASCSRVIAQADPQAAAQLSAAFTKAEQHRAKGELADAIKQYEIAVRLAPKVYGADDINTANLVNNLGLLYQENGLPAKAEPFLRHSLTLYTKKLPANDARIATAQNNLGDLYRLLSDYEKAEEFYRQSLKSREENLGPDHLDVAQVLNSLGILHMLRGELAESDAHLRRALRIREAKQGKDHLDVSMLLMTLGALYRQLGQDAVAESIYQRALSIREKQLPADHPDIANTLINLGSAQASQGQYAKALPILNRSLQMYEKKLGADHHTVAISLNSIGEVQRALGQVAEAEASFRRALTIWEARYGKGHPNVAVALHNLGLSYVMLALPAEAEARFQRALQICQTVFGSDHPRVAEELTSLAQVRASRQQWSEAAQLTDQARRITRRHVAKTLPVLAEAEQLRFLAQRHEPELHQALSLGLRRRNDEAIVNLSGSWVLNGKAVAQQTLAESTLLARDSADPTQAQYLKELVTIRRKLANRSFNAAGAENKTTLKEFAQLAAQEQELSRRLRQAGSRHGKEDPWVELAAVQQAVPADAVLIEMARFRLFDPAARGTASPWLAPRYAAWIIPAADKGAVRLVDLGDAAAIEAAVAKARQSLQASADAIRKRGAKQSEQELLESLNELAALVLKPLLPLAGQAKHWILSPDASLWLIPWSALPEQEGKYVIENHRVTFVVSGRDLLEQPVARAVTRPLIIADPDYDLDRESARKIAEQIATSGAPLRSVRSTSRGLILPLVQRLPGTAKEARTIAPSLAKYAAVTPELRVEKQAQEKLVKAVRSPRVLVLSTHGFFLEDQRTTAAAGSTRFVNSAGKTPENPLLRCGLLFAGVNRRDQALRTDDEDGILTGLEIAGLDLRGTEMVVLSACETGLGQVHNGEGVAGLRQAFQLAGARTVLSTLWQIDDAASADLMGSFFGQLANGQTRPEALRTAQLALIKSHRAKSGAAHPFFWAAYTLTGE